MTNVSSLHNIAKIGITGHRILLNPQTLSACLDNILTTGYLDAFTPESREKLASTKSPPIHLTLISPLAEGADRLAAHVALRHGCTVDALLPMPREEYEKDFDTSESRSEFNDLLTKAQRATVVTCDAAPTDADYRQKAYLAVGTETVNRCDILIALWDGKPSRGMGGTADVVALALAQQKPVVIISTTNPGVVELRNGGTLDINSMEDISAFKSPQIDDADLDKYVGNVFVELFAVPFGDQIPDNLKNIIRTHLIPTYCKASISAKYFQERFNDTGARGYTYSTLSVFVMALSIVFGSMPAIAVICTSIELLLLLILFEMIHRAEHEKVHLGWLQHRGLAERLRIAFYYVACGERPPLSAREISLKRGEQSWIDQMYHQTVSSLPSFARSAEPALEVYREYISSGWVQGQIEYHKGKAEREQAKNRRLKRLGMWSFIMAIVVSCLHLYIATQGMQGHHPEGGTLALEMVLSVLAITLPAAGAAFSGYRSLMENSRIGARSKAMALHLSRIQDHEIADETSLRRYLERLEDVMLLESEDWLALMEHAELEKIA